MRFISQDPLGGSINEYTYADDNPVMETDPTGEFGAGVLGLTGLADLTGFDAAAGWVPVIGWAVVSVTVVWGGYEVWHHYRASNTRPPNLSPPGAGRRGELRGIPGGSSWTSASRSLR